MWGEIEATPPCSHETSDRPRTTVVEPADSNTAGPLLGCDFTHTNTAGPLLGCDFTHTNTAGPLLGCDFKHTQAPLQNKQHTSDGVLQAVSSSVSAMLEVVAVSGCMVKSQQIGDAELTVDERRQELLKQYQSRPLVFLERYQAYLKPKHLEAFSSLRSDSRAQHYRRVIQRRAVGHADKTRVRNQRYAALRALQRDGQYFSEEQMRTRQPLLYEQYIGQHLTDDELLVRSQEAMQGGGAEGQAGCPGGEGNAGLAHLLLDSYQERLIQNQLQEEHEREEAAREEDEDEEDGGVSGKEEWEPTPQEKAMLREEFVSQMHQRFLDGKDKDFNYSEVDENPDYDNLDIVSRDAEDKYFDDDEEEEEEDDDDEEENEQDEDEKMTE